MAGGFPTLSLKGEEELCENRDAWAQNALRASIFAVHPAEVYEPNRIICTLRKMLIQNIQIDA
jgi:hypothetical protein